jgi:basic membrane protein A
MDKKFESKGWTYGIKQGSIKLADFHGLDGNVKPDVLKAVDAKFADIKDGKFEVPHDTSKVE